MNSLMADIVREERERARVGALPPPATATQVGGTHYTGMPIQPAQFILANGIGWAEGSIIAYLSRWRAKNGLEDLKKAQHLLAILIEHEEAK